MSYYQITTEVDPHSATDRWGDGISKYEFEQLAEQQFGVHFDLVDYSREKYFNEWKTVLIKYKTRTNVIPSFDDFMAKVKKELEELEETE